MNFQELLLDLENQRKVVMKRIKYSVIISVVIILISLLFDESGLIVGIIVSIILSAILIASSVNEYKKSFKSKFMPLIIEKVGMDLNYDFKSGISRDVVLQSRLFKQPDRYHCEDLMHGSFEDVNFVSSDVHMEERHVTTDSKGNRRVYYETYFQGRWFIYEFNKEFNGVIQVREDGFFEGPSWGLKVKKVSLEDVEFNKKFKTYSTNEHDAFYVLTPSLMEKIKELERRYPGKIYFSFIGKQLHIGIYNSKDAFEPPIWTPLNDEFVESQILDILILKDIVNELKLNRKIFKD